MRRVLIGGGAVLGCCLLGWPPAAWASPEEEQEGRSVVGSLENGEGQAVLEVQGRFVGFPDGTRLMVSLRVPSAGDRPPSTATQFRVDLQDQGFSVQRTWEGRRLAPLRYFVRVDLVVNQQPPGVLAWRGIL